MVWDQNDFEIMGWHDNPVYALSFEDNVILDLDYIFKWVQPLTPKSNYWFLISPGTLIFKKPTKLEVDLEMGFVNGLEVIDINREIRDGKMTTS